MNDDIFEQLKAFVIQQRWEYDFPLTKETKVQNDLRITGDDAVEFLIAYGKQFDVNVTGFMAADYFAGEGRMNFFGYGTKKTLTLGHLVKGIQAKRLDEDVIQS